MSDAPPSVLIVDDTIENLRLLAGILGEHGYEVRPVTSGEDALQAARLHVPDLVLLDVNMPGLDGFQVCEGLRSVAATSDVPVVFLTALAETADKVRAFQVGGVDFITKPFQVEEVLARVRTHVALHRTRRDLARTVEKLRELEQLRDDLVHMVVHDMRSPLNVILGHLDLLCDPVKQALGVHESEGLQAALRATRAVTRMSNDLLDVRRLEEGKLPVVRAACDLSELASAVRASLSGWKRARPIELESPGSVFVECDGKLIQRVMENLVTNALKHTAPDKNVRVRVRQDRAGARFEVQDDGPGVPADCRERIFEKFGSVAVRTEHSYHSAGLGLAFCKLAVAAHGGAIGVSCPDDGGSVFWFELPAP